jgi:hypothetical protein
VVLICIFNIGMTSLRNPCTGSLYIQAICDVFRQRSPNDHVMDMLIKVSF